MGFNFGGLTKEIAKVNPAKHIASAGTQIVKTGSEIGKTIPATGSQIGDAVSSGIKKIPDPNLDEKFNTKNITTFAGSVGDLLYPDNPKLRQRAEQLEKDCRDFETRFNDAKKDFDKLEDKIRAAITKYLKARGFDSLDDLDAEVRRVATGKVFEEWERLRMNIGRNLAIENVIETVCGIAALGGLTVTGALVTVGIISGPAGWSALGAVGTATAIIGAGLFLGALIQAIDQNDKLKDHIEQLYYARSDLKLNLNRLNLLIDWLIAFTTYLDMTDDATFRSFGFLFDELEKRDKWRWTPSKVTEELVEYDQMRQAWTAADPHPKY